MNQNWTNPLLYQTRYILIAVVTIVGGVVGGASLSHAAPLGTISTREPPKGIPVGIFRIDPKITVTSRWDDNVYKTATDERSDLIVHIKPTIRLVTHWLRGVFDLSYQSVINQYKISEHENHINQKLNVKVGLVPSKKSKIDLEYDILLEHDERGAPASTSIEKSLGPNRWLTRSLKGGFNYHLNRMSSELKLEYAERRSLNNAQSSQDRHWNDGGLTLSWSLAAKTDLLLELGRKEIVYDMASKQESNSEEMRLLVGAAYKTIKKIESNIKIGMTAKKFAYAAEQDHSSSSWESGVTWSPRRRTKLKFSSTRNFQESGEAASSYVSTKFHTDIKHDLRPRFSFLSSLELSNSQYKNAKQDDYWSGTLGLEYRMPHNFLLNAEFSHKIKRSTTAGAEYDSNGLLLSVVGTL